MIAEIHQLKPKLVATNWMCSACGVDAGCNCGAPLMSKSQRIADAVAANPEKSSREIAKDVGVSHTAVDNVRNATGNHLPVDDETRIGADGKRRRMPVRDDADYEFSSKELAERDRGSFLLRVQEARNFAFYEGKVDEKLIEFARGTAAAWCELVKKLEQEI